MYSSDWSGSVPLITISNTFDSNTQKLTNMKLNIQLAGVDPSTVSRI